MKPQRDAFIFTLMLAALIFAIAVLVKNLPL